MCPKVRLIIISFFLLTVLLVPGYSFSDVGNCARYKLYLIFNNGDSLSCFLQFGGYDSGLKYLSEEEILQRINKFFPSGEITVYKKIQAINYPEQSEGQRYYDFKCSAVADSDRVVIGIDSVSRVNKLDVSRCEYGNFPEDDHYAIHFTSQVIESLSQREIDLLQKKPYSLILTGPPDPGALVIDFCLSYNKNIDQKRLKKLCNLYLKNEGKLPRHEFAELQGKYFEEVKRKLKKMNIIVIRLYGYD